MAKKPSVLKGLILLLESMSEKEADEALKKIGIDPKDYGMNKGNDLIDHWRRCLNDLTGKE